MKSKPWYFSKTIIVALLQGVLGVVVALSTQHPEIGIIAMIKSCLDMVLRFVTTTPIE